LNIDGVEVFQRDPVNLLRLFVIADRRGLDLHPDAFTAVTRSLALVTPKMRRDPRAAQAFLDVLARGRHVELYGTVDSQSDKEVDYMRANGVPGVFSVKNYLQVAGQPGEKQQQ